MRKILLPILILLIFSIAACKQAVKEDATKKATETPKIETTGDAAVDAVGKDLNNADSIEKDLGTDELSDLDSGLADIQNI